MRFFRALLVVLALLAATYGLLALTARPATEHPYFDQFAAEPLALAHGGGQRLWPDNSLRAFMGATDLGADVLEIDVHQDADGVFRVIHDATVDRTTDGTGRVSRLTVAELRRLDAGMGQTVPTLDDVFEAFGPSMLYNVELKEYGLWGRGLESAVADRIDAYHLHNQVVVSSFDPFSVRRARRRLSASTMTALLWMNGPRRLRRLLAPAEADHPHHPLVDEAYMAWARARDLRVHTWTVDDPQEAKRLAALGVHALITNRPRELLAALGDGDT